MMACVMRMARRLPGPHRSPMVDPSGSPASPPPTSHGGSSMRRILTTLALTALFGTTVLVGDSRACHRRKHHCGCGGSGYTTVAYAGGCGSYGYAGGSGYPGGYA